MEQVLAIVITIAMALLVQVLVFLNSIKKEIWDEIYKKYFGGKDD